MISTVLIRKAGMDDSQRAQAEGQARMLFQEIDKDRDGRLTVREMMDYTTKKGPIDPIAMDKAFHNFFAADTDKSETLSEEEFVRHYVESQA
ncbi:EF-hand domain-containing protein [Streptomyces sp. NBC_00354]|uniref:EF-hand domain-containing protein n=1 Tax=Streptomyces sp. NBC_00354 TaxID=2975723 RepID=UPI002E269122